jgi:hypothetical protein
VLPKLRKSPHTLPPCIAEWADQTPMQFPTVISSALTSWLYKLQGTPSVSTWEQTTHSRWRRSRYEQLSADLLTHNWTCTLACC